MREVVIVAATRTAIGSFQGSPAQIPAVELGATVVRALLEKTHLDADLVNDHARNMLTSMPCGDVHGAAPYFYLHLLGQIQGRPGLHGSHRSLMQNVAGPLKPLPRCSPRQPAPKPRKRYKARSSPPRPTPKFVPTLGSLSSYARRTVEAVCSQQKFMWTCTNGLSLSIMNSNSRELQHHDIFRGRLPNG